MIAMKFFGNGHGMAAPYFDQTFYWLNDRTLNQGKAKGRFYTWIGGFGAQLGSFEWRCPKPGTRRVLAGTTFTVFTANRSRFGLMWDVTWSIVDFPQHDINAANTMLAEVKSRLGSASL